jgi:hypothetical protein
MAAVADESGLPQTRREQSVKLILAHERDIAGDPGRKWLNRLRALGCNLVSALSQTQCRSCFRRLQGKEKKNEKKAKEKEKHSHD